MSLSPSRLHQDCYNRKQGAEERGARHPRPEGPNAGRDVSQEAAQGAAAEARGEEECREAEKEGETDCQSGFRGKPGHRRWFGPVQRSLVQKNQLERYLLWLWTFLFVVLLDFRKYLSRVQLVNLKQ